MTQPAAYSRRPGDPFDDRRVEVFAHSRALGKSMRASAEAAGVGIGQAKTWEQAPEVWERRRELSTGSQTAVTVSAAWIVEQLKQNAVQAQKAGRFKDSTDTLELLYKIIKTDRDLIDGVASKLPAGKPDRDEIRKRLSAATGTQSFDVTTDGEPVETLQ